MAPFGTYRSKCESVGCVGLVVLVNTSASEWERARMHKYSL